MLLFVSCYQVPTIAIPLVLLLRFYHIFNYCSNYVICVMVTYYPRPSPYVSARIPFQLKTKKKKGEFILIKILVILHFFLFFSFWIFLFSKRFMFWFFITTLLFFCKNFKQILFEITTFQRANSTEMSILTKRYVHFDENFGAWKTHVKFD